MRIDRLLERPFYVPIEVLKRSCWRNSFNHSDAAITISTVDYTHINS